MLLNSNGIGGTEIARILFVEFHRTFRQATSWVLDQSGKLEVVAQAGTVAEGREKMAEGGIDAALVDIPLPDEGAAAFVQALCEANPSVPVLVLTIVEDHEVHEEFLEAGASEVLSKRLTAEEVVAAVERLVGEGPEMVGVRVLISYEDSHLAYRDVMADAIQSLRPHAEVRTVYLRALKDEVERVNPHLIICSRPNTVDPSGRAAWVMLAPEPDDLSEVCIGGRRWEATNPGLEELLSVVDQTEELLRIGYPLGGC